MSPQSEWNKRNKNKTDAATKKWREKTKGWHRRSHLKRYGLTPEQYDEMVVAQGNTCAICFSTDPRGHGTWHVDHCHKTGVVRALLCTNCNSVLGHAKDNPTILASAINYLRTHNGEEHCSK